LTNLPVPLGRNYQQMYRTPPDSSADQLPLIPSNPSKALSSTSTAPATIRTARVSTALVRITFCCRT
jgi:hypothetical protein